MASDFTKSAQYNDRDSPPRLLLITADSNDRMYVSNLLARSFQIETATDTVSGIECVRRHRPALIIADALLGGDGAYALVRALRDLGFVPGTPLILLTASIRPPASDGFDPSGLLFLPKPFGARQLHDVTEEALRKHEGRVTGDAKARLEREIARAEERERKRLMTQLHDHLAQSLVLARMTLAATAKRVESASIQQDLQSVDSLLTDAITFTRTLLSQPPSAAHFSELVDALRDTATRMRQFNLRVDIQASAACATPHAALVADCVRELLINVVKHAGTDRAIVRVGRQDARRCVVTVEDCGRGFGNVAESESPGGAFGLGSVVARIQEIGGTVEIASQPHAGTRVTIVFPIGG